MTESPLVDRLMRKGVFDDVKEISNVEAAAKISEHRRKAVSHSSGRLHTWMMLLDFECEYRHEKFPERRSVNGSNDYRKWWVKE